MNKRLFTLIAAAVVAVCAIAQEMAVTLDAYKKRAFIVGTDTLLYRELTPEKPEKQQYPLVVFMHGAGERGIDNEKQLTHGAQMFLNPVNRKKYPAYVVFPQCPETGYWAYNERPTTFNPDEMPILEEPTKWIKMVRGLVTRYVNDGNVDPSRVYIIGLSMGGMAVYDLAERYPTMWAAAVPICGTVNPKRLDKARTVKFRIFHGDADNVVPVEASRKAYLALKKLGAEVDYMEFPGCTHGSWNLAFSQPDFMKWLFSHSRASKK